MKVRNTLLLLLLVIYQLMISSCARKVYPEVTLPETGSRAENKQLQEFMEGGVEKAVDTHNVTPDKIIESARKYLGVPHCMGGTSMKCIDCSGLLVAVFAGYGIDLPHNSEAQARYGKIISDPAKLLKGDLVFFIRSYKSGNFITHSGICIDSYKFIHTSTTLGVTITSLNDPWWHERFLFGTRIFN